MWQSLRSDRFADLGPASVQPGATGRRRQQVPIAGAAATTADVVGGVMHAK